VETPPPRTPARSSTGPTTPPKRGLWIAGFAALAAALVAGGLYALKPTPPPVAAPPPLSLQIVTDPPGAEVTIDTQRQALRTPSTFSLARAPSYLVRVERDGSRAHEERIAVPPGASAHSVVMKLEPLTAAVARLKVHTNAKRASFRLDGKPVGDGAGDLTLDTIAPGSHRLAVEARGFLPREQPIAIAPNEVAELEWALRPAPAATGKEHPSSLSDVPNQKFTAPK
jgi:hypothetical protein